MTKRDLLIASACAGIAAVEQIRDDPQIVIKSVYAHRENRDFLVTHEEDLLIIEEFVA